MRAVGRRVTPPEIAIRSILHRRGLRFRVDKAPLKGLRRKADIVFGPTLVAVFIDGCFWHGCPLHATWPKSNAEWWRNKIRANQERDRDTDRKLEQAGWSVIRVWEHDDPENSADWIETIVRAAKKRF